MSHGQTYYLRVWTGRLSGALKAGEGKLKLLDLFGDEEYSNADAFSSVGEGRYDAEISISASAWDYVVRVEMEDLSDERFCYSSVVRIVE